MLIIWGFVAQRQQQEAAQQLKKQQAAYAIYERNTRVNALTTDNSAEPTPPNKSAKMLGKRPGKSVNSYSSTPASLPAPALAPLACKPLGRPLFARLTMPKSVKSAT